MTRKGFVLLVVLALVGGCAALCPNKGKLMGVFTQTQSAYDTYVQQSKNNSAPVVLADQILAIAGPWAAGSLASACPPDDVVKEISDKAGLIK